MRNRPRAIPIAAVSVAWLMRQRRASRETAEQFLAEADAREEKLRRVRLVRDALLCLLVAAALLACVTRGGGS